MGDTNWTKFKNSCHKMYARMYYNGTNMNTQNNPFLLVFIIKKSYALKLSISSFIVPLKLGCTN